jgi:hypothetical protein
MRIAGGIIGIFLALIILVQSLAAGTANGLAEAGGSQSDSGGSIGFLVAVLFVVGSALLFGSVFRGALGTWLAAAGLALIGGATTIFGDLIVWGVIAAVYAGGCFWARRRGHSTRRGAEVNAAT